MGSMCRVHAGSGMIGEMDMIKVLGKKNNSKKSCYYVEEKKGQSTELFIYILLDKRKIF